MKLVEAISKLNSHSPADLKVIYADFSEDPGFVASLLTLLVNNNTEIKSSWLLKHYLSCGNQLTSQQNSQLFHLLAGLDNWQAQLEILQSLSYMPVQPADRSVVEAFLRRCLASANKFVRAWSYNGFDILAEQYPQYRAEVDLFFEMAMNDEAASVKARIRNIVKNRSRSH